MTENNSQDQNANKWDRVESRIKSRGGSVPKTEHVANPLALVEDNPPHQFVPSEISVPEPDTEASHGILMQWQKGQISKKAALEALQVKYDAQLDALKFQLSKAVNVSNARADRIAEEFLKKLDSEHIQVLKGLGLRNAETRASALIEIRDMIASKLNEVQTKNWPPALVDRTIDDLLDLEKRVCSEMMKELGA